MARTLKRRAIPVQGIQRKVSARTIGRIEKISTIGKSCRRRMGCQPVRISKVLSPAVVQQRSRPPCDFAGGACCSSPGDPCFWPLIPWNENQSARRSAAPNPLRPCVLIVPKVRELSSDSSGHRTRGRRRTSRGERKKQLLKSLVINLDLRKKGCALSAAAFFRIHQFVNEQSRTTGAHF